MTPLTDREKGDRYNITLIIQDALDHAYEKIVDGPSFVEYDGATIQNMVAWFGTDFAANFKEWWDETGQSATKEWERA